jgi:hypothetical protein
MTSSQFDQSADVVSLFSVLSTAKVNTSSIDSIFTISILSALKRHFELRYRLDFSDILNLLIMKCMKNVIDSASSKVTIIQEDDERFSRKE